MSETNTTITAYGNALDVLTQQCRDLICRDTWVAVHGLAARADHISADVGHTCDVVDDIRKDVERMHHGVKDMREDVRYALEGVRHVQGAIRHALNSIETIGKDGFHTTVTCPK